MTDRPAGLSLVIPAYNEEAAIAHVLEEASAVLGALDVPHEIIVVDDASADRTAEIAQAANVTVLCNVQNGGYGYSLMRGIGHARFDTIAIADADGSYPLAALPALWAEHRRGVAMVVAHRRGAHYRGSAGLALVRWCFQALAEFIVGRSVPDVNSGMRIFDRAAVLPLLPYMSYGFSFTTSITLLFMLQAQPVSYVPVEYRKRRGSSKVRYFRDARRALQIVASVAVRLNPIKLFLMAAGLNLLLLVPVALAGLRSAGLLVALTLVVETSVVLVALGLVVEGLIDKTQFFRGVASEPRDHEGGRGDGPAG